MDESTRINPAEPVAPTPNASTYDYSYSAPVLNNTAGVVMLGIITIILIFLLARSNRQYRKLLEKTLF